ncbi:MAG: hypothetical protein JNG84_07655 [Archangium sp.]|nr:hypothetical protein [Archangium sp.]
MPPASATGASRTSVFIGVDFNALEWLDFGLEVHLPLVGDAFQAKGVAFVGARF